MSDNLESSAIDFFSAEMFLVTHKRLVHTGRPGLGQFVGTDDTNAILSSILSGP